MTKSTGKRRPGDEITTGTYIYLVFFRSDVFTDKAQFGLVEISFFPDSKSL